MEESGKDRWDGLRTDGEDGLRTDSEGKGGIGAGLLFRASFFDRHFLLPPLHTTPSSPSPPRTKFPWLVLRIGTFSTSSLASHFHISRNQRVMRAFLHTSIFSTIPVVSSFQISPHECNYLCEQRTMN